MAHLNLQLFGPGILTVAGAEVRPHSSKTIALLAFLAFESDRSHTRARLAGLLWGRSSDQSARQSLRQALYSLRTVGAGQLHDCLHADHERVRLAADPNIDVDLQRFMDDVRSADVQRWQSAARLYRAPLLDGKAFDGCEDYESWLCAAREGLHALAVQNLDRLIAYHISRADWAAALPLALSLRELEPGSQPAARHLFRILAATGDLRALDQPGLSEACDASEVEAWVHAARAAERVYAFSQAADLYDRALSLLKLALPASSERCCEVLLLKEAALERLGRRADQISAIHEALAIAEPLGDEARLATILLRMAGACTYLGRHAEACRAAERALAIYRETGETPGEAEALRELGFVHWHAENHASALHYARDALSLHRRLGDIVGEASALHNLAEIHRALGSPRLALEWYEQALQLHWAAQNHQGEILSLFGMANALHQAGDPSASTETCERALKLSERHGERTMQSRALHALAMQHGAQSQLDAALAFLRRAIDVDRAIGYAHALGHDLVDLADLHMRRRERSEARAALQESLVWFDFTQASEARASIRAALSDLSAGRDPTPARAGRRRGVKSHLPLSEGKVYCEFESPLGVSSTG